MNTKMKCATAAALVAATVSGSAHAAITVDLGKTPLKDQRQSRAGSGIGYNGGICDLWGRAYFEPFLVDHPDETWEEIRKGGGWITRVAGNNLWQDRRAPFMVATEKEKKAVLKRTGWDDSHDWNKVAFDFKKKHGIKTIICLENYSVVTNYATGARSDDIRDVKRVMCEFVQWIVDNGYKDQVIGFELGNEPYGGNDPENFAERWAEIVPEMKRIFPEASIGFSCAEYRAGDPDLDAIRRRSTRVDKWDDSNEGYFGFMRPNQWTGRFIVAFTNGIDYCDHVVYHFYGGDIPDGMGCCGFARVRRLAQVFPEIAKKRIWITEYRERSDEDDRCQQMHSSTITKAHYMLMTTAAPTFDMTACHCFAGLAGGLMFTNGRGSWVGQWDPAGRDFTDPDFTGRPRIFAGNAGPLFQYYNEALADHPIIVEHGLWDHTKNPEECWTSALYYASTGKITQWHLFGEKGPRPKVRGEPEWVVARNPETNSVAVLFCNSLEVPCAADFAFPGYRIVGKAHVRAFRGKPEEQMLHQIPGEARLCWCEEYDADPVGLKLPETTIATITYKVEKEKKP